MDYDTLKSYMMSTSIKDHVNSTLASVQKRLLNVNKLERQAKRNDRLTQIRNIPENLSACSTPQVDRIIAHKDVNKPATYNVSKLYEEKLKMRLQRLNDFKEKREKVKREEALNKKPMFKVTHADLEKYDLHKVYGNLKGIPVPYNETYKFKAPKNIHSISLAKKTPVKEKIESPRKRITRATTRLQADKLKLKANAEVTLDGVKTRNKVASECEGLGKVPQMAKTPTKPLISQRNRKVTKTASASEYVSQKSKNSFKSRLETSKSEEILDPSKASVFITKTEKTLADSNLPAENKKLVDKTPLKAAVKITEAEQSLADANLPQILIKEPKEVVNLPLTPSKAPKNKLSRKNQIKNSSSVSNAKTENDSSEIKVKSLKVADLVRQIEASPVLSKIKPNNPISLKKTKTEVNNIDQTEKDIPAQSKIIINRRATRFNSGKMIDKPKTPDSKKTTNINLPNLLAVNGKDAEIENNINQANVKGTESFEVKTSENVGQIRNCAKIDESPVLSKTPSKIKLNLKKTKTELNNVDQEEKDTSAQSKIIINRRMTRLNSEKMVDGNLTTQTPDSNKTTNIKVPNLLEVNGKDAEIDYNINKADVKGRESFQAKTPENVGEKPSSAEKDNSLKTPTGATEAGDNCVYISPFVTVSRGKQRARVEFAQRQTSGGIIDSPALQQSTNIKTATEYFTLLLNKEINKIDSNCEYWNTFKSEKTLPEEAVDLIDVATGQGALLKNKKMQTFRNLIQYSLEENADKIVTSMDLHGYWDVLNIQIDNVTTRFENLAKIRDNNWKEILPEKPKNRMTITKKVSKPKANNKRSNSLRQAIKLARLRSKQSASSSETSSPIRSAKTPKQGRKSTNRNSVSSAKDSNNRVSSLRSTRGNANISPRPGSPHIIMQISQVAKSVDRIGSEAVHSAKSILKKREAFKLSGRKPKVVLFDVSDDAAEDAVSIQENIHVEEHKSPHLRRSKRLL